MKHFTNLRWLIMSLLLAVGASAWGETGTITFGAPDDVKINAASVTGTDDLNHTWTITTVGTTSFTNNNNTGFSQVGSKNSPATSITFTTTLPSSVNITSMSAKFGGFSGTAGTITLKVGDTSIGTGSLNGANAVTVSSTSTASGNLLTVTVTGISRGVACYYISYTYETGGGTQLPTISADDATVAFDATSGEISYSIENPVSGATLSASSTDTWISNCTVNSSTITFNVSENTGTSDRTGTITLTYANGGTTLATKEVSVTQGHETLDYVILPFSWDGGTSAQLTALDGVSAEGLGTDYAESNAPYRVKFDTTEDYILFKTDSQPGKVTIAVKMIGGANTSSITVQESSDGTNFTNVQTLSISGAQNSVLSLETTSPFASTSRFIKLTFTRGSNVGVGPITIEKPNNEPSLSFSSATADVYVEETYTQTVNAYNTGSNAITYATSNAEIATVDASTGEVTGVTAGTVTITASVTVDGTLYTATYDVTVKKNDAELSFAQAVVSITEGETYAGQTVTKPSDILDSEITYSSNNPSVATVDAATGAITVGSALGSATITATFAGNTKYNEATATYTFKVTASSGASGDYVKVTSTEDLTDGEYLIVYEDGSVAFNGGLSTLDVASNYISVTITDDDKIESTAEVDAAAFTISTVDGGFSILSASGWYIGRTANSNGITTSETTAYVNSIEIDNNHDAVITVSNGRILRYNSDSGQTRFRYYGSGQKAIQLYKKSGSTGPSVAVPVISPETGTYETRPQTVTITCSTTGATIHYTTDGTTPTTSSPVYTDSFDVNKNTTVQAIAVLTVDGQEVVSRVSSSVISMYVHAPVFSPVDGSEFTEDYQVTITADAGLTIYYIVQDNKIFNTDAGGRTASASDGNGTLVSTALVYSSPLTFGRSMMVTAICMDADGNLSDPVTVKYTYSGAVVPPYYSSFSASEGDFTKTQETDENTITGSGAPEWRMNSNTGADAIARWGEERYYMYVRGTSGSTVQSRTRWYGSAYLTSPIIDLTGKGSASFSFIHAAHHFYNDPNTSATVKDATLETTLSDAKIPQACKVQVGVCDDSGNVSSWTDIASTSITWPEQLFDPSKTGVSADGKSTTNASSRSGLFPRANSGDISLSAYEDQKIRIRFVYTSTPQNYGTWNIDQVTVNAIDVEEMTMNSKGWTTYVFDHDIDAYQTTQNYISGDEETLKIYKVTEFDRETCVLQQLGKFEEYTTENNSERYIPAKTPVVIEGPAGATINFIEYTSSSMLPTVKNNLLIASLNPNLAVAPAGSGVRYFVLQWNNSTNRPWFNKVSEGRSVPDHKAYLNGTDQCEAVSTTQSVKSMGIYILGDEEEEATTIANIEEIVNTKDNIFYNLAGQRVLNPTKGIYIVNGKKVLFK